MSIPSAVNFFDSLDEATPTRRGTEIPRGTDFLERGDSDVTVN